MIEVNKDEKILRVMRKHWFVLLGNAFILLVFITMPPIVLFMLHLLPIETLLAFTGSTVAAGGFFLFGWLSFVWMVAAYMWTDYFLDMLIVTDRRIFDIEQRGFFSRKSQSFHIDRLQDITVDQRGIIATLLNFGTIHFETAGEGEKLVMPYIAQPYDVKKYINTLQDKHAIRSQLVHFDAHMSGSHITADKKAEDEGV